MHLMYCIFLAINFMYNYNLKCTYHLISDEEESELLYNIQFLQAFDVTDWNSEIILQRLNDINSFMKSDCKFNKIIQYLYDKLNSQSQNVMAQLCSDESSAVCYLLGYGLFHVTQDAFNEHYVNGDISDETYDKLIKAIDNEFAFDE